MKEHIWGGDPRLHLSKAGSSEDPWDGTGYGFSRVRAESVNAAGSFGYLLMFLSISLLLVLLMAGAARSQTPGVSAGKKKHGKVEQQKELDKETLKLAEEYVFLLEQLVFLSTDYCGYFEKLDTKEAKENYKSLYSLCSKLSTTGYYDNLENLIKEIADLKKEMANSEHKLAKLLHNLRKQPADDKRAQANLKALRLTSIYRSELAALEAQLETEVASQTESNHNKREIIQHYVRQLVKDSVLLLSSGIATVSVPQFIVLTELDGLDSTTLIVNLLDVPDHEFIVIPDVPDISEIPGTEELKKRERGPRAPAYSIGVSVNQLEDSLDVDSDETKLFVINPIGELTITGWSRPKIKASCNVTVASARSGRAEEFSEQLHLRMYLKHDNVYVESVVPHLTDPKTKISNSKLELMVPFGNELFVNNSSGAVHVANIQNGISIRSSNSHIDLKRVEGIVKIVNSSGPIYLERVNGAMTVQNRMGPVTIQNCYGAIELDNSFGEITIERCEGDAIIRNTGVIAVDNHTGNVEISNRNGRVDVNNLDGNLTVYNSFEPLIVHNVTGSVRLENTNAMVEAVQIDGRLSINNRFGQITASSIAGPVNIESRNGNVLIQLGRLLSGESQVITSGGQVILAVSPLNDLLVTMESRGGEIDISDFDSKVFTKEPGVSSAELAIGKGANLLAVKSNNSRIVVKESH